MFKGWEIDFEVVENDARFDHLKSFCLVQKLIETDDDEPMSGKAQMRVTQKGRALWLLLDSARRLETGVP